MLFRIETTLFSVTALNVLGISQIWNFKSYMLKKVNSQVKKDVVAIF